MEFRTADTFTSALGRLFNGPEPLVVIADTAEAEQMAVAEFERFASAKGLEFKAVAVIGCDEDQLPLRSRIESAADEVELDDVFATERQLFYVACTRARDRLLVSGVKPGSEFVMDLKSG